MAKIKSSQWYSLNRPQGNSVNQCLRYRTANGLVKNGSPIHKTDICIQFK